MRFFASVSLVVVSVSASFGQNVVQNGSFENPPVVAPGYVTYTSSFQNWTVTSGSVDLVGVNGNANAYTNWANAVAANGTQVLDLSGSSRGTILQTVTPGSGNTAINLAFNFSRNIDFTGSGTFTGQVRVFDGSNVYYTQSFTRDASTDGATLSDFNWSSFTQNNISIGSSTTVNIEFTDLSAVNIPSTQGIILDNVSVNPVPEPASIFALCTLAGMAMTRIRVR